MLRLLRDSVKPDTKLLLVEMILPLACHDDSTSDGGDSLPEAVKSLVPKGSPLLPSLGLASVNGFYLDISVRTGTVYYAIGRSDGWIR